MNFETPILFLIFNRPDTSIKIFNRIREVKPKRLYIASDGAREKKHGESEIVSQLRSNIISLVDWDCEVKTLFRDNNLGCKVAIFSAIDWFFSNESQGIILEDDCFPSLDFFDYCNWGLNRFKDDKNVWHINGNNFGFGSDPHDKDPVGYVSLAQVWGWATWRDRWEKCNANPFYLEHDVIHKFNKGYNWNISKFARLKKINHIKMLKDGLDAWDYQWQVSILNNSGRVLSCKKNLISNLGDDENATHTQGDNRCHLVHDRVDFEWDSLSQFSYENKLNKWLENRMGLSILPIKSNAFFLKNVFKCIKEKIKRISVLSIFGKEKKIIVASTGRSGSTLIHDTIKVDYVSWRFGSSPKLLKNIFVNLVGCFSDRLYEIKDSTPPVIKTHDLASNIKPDYKYLFIYGDPLESAKSVELMTEKYGYEWFEEHQFHLCAEGGLSDLYTKDILNYQGQMKSWFAAENNNKNVLCIDFDELWDSVDEISTFLGFDINLPAKKPRAMKSEKNKISYDFFKTLNEFKANLKSNRV